MARPSRILQTWALILVLLVCLLIAVASRAQVKAAECEPAYLAMEPDTGIWYGFEVATVTEGRAWTYAFKFPSRARCEEARQVALDLQGHTAGLVKVGGCF